MRLIFAAVTAAMLISSSAATAAVVDVLSGDTIRIEGKIWHIAYIDAPQINHVCAAEAKLGVAAQAKLAGLVAQGEMEIRPTRLFDLNGRPLAFVLINGQDVGAAMLAAHLAIPFGAGHPPCMAEITDPKVQQAVDERPKPRGSVIQQGIERSRGSTSLPGRP